MDVMQECEDENLAMPQEADLPGEMEENDYSSEEIESHSYIPRFFRSQPQSQVQCKEKTSTTDSENDSSGNPSSEDNQVWKWKRKIARHLISVIARLYRRLPRPGTRYLVKLNETFRRIVCHEHTVKGIIV